MTFIFWFLKRSIPLITRRSCLRFGIQSEMLVIDNVCWQLTMPPIQLLYKAAIREQQSNYLHQLGERIKVVNQCTITGAYFTTLLHISTFQRHKWLFPNDVTWYDKRSIHLIQFELSVPRMWVFSMDWNNKEMIKTMVWVYQKHPSKLHIVSNM